MTLCRSDKDLDIDYDDNDVLTFCNRATNNSTDRRIKWAGARISTDFLTKFVKVNKRGNRSRVTKVVTHTQ